MTVQPANPGWLDRLAVENRRQYLAPLPGVDSDGPHVVFRFDQNSSGRTETLSMAAIPSGERLTIELLSAARWTLTDLDRASQLTVVVRLPGVGTAKAKLHLASSVEGAIDMDLRDSEMTVTADEGSSGVVRLLSGTLISGVEGLGGTQFEVAAGVLGGGNFETVRLVGNAVLEPVSNQPLGIKRLRVDGERELQLSLNTTKTQISGIEADGKRAFIRFTPPVAQRKSGLRQVVILNVDTLDNLIIGADPSIKIAIQKSASTVTFRGPMEADFEGEAIGDAIHFEEKEGLPRLDAKPGAVIDQVSGDLILAGIKGAQLSGGNNGFTIHDIRPNQSAGRSSTTDGICEGAFLTGFRVPGGLRGRSILNHLDDAHHVEPATDRLPGWNYRWISPRRRANGSRATGGADPALRHDAEMMRKLHELSRDKGASGSVRTKVGWCAQVLRHKTTTGRVERIALWGYRALGYGERPGPPALTWLVLSLIFTVLLMGLKPGDLMWIKPGDVEGLAGFLQLWIERAVSPVGAVVGSGAGTEKDAWLYLIRAVVAIPLVVAALALRKYVQSGR